MQTLTCSSQYYWCECDHQVAGQTDHYELFGDQLKEVKNGQNTHQTFILNILELHTTIVCLSLYTVVNNIHVDFVNSIENQCK